MEGSLQGSSMVKVMGAVSVYIEVREEKTDTYTAVLRCLGHDLMVLRSCPILWTIIPPNKPPQTEHGPVGMI